MKHKLIINILLIFIGLTLAGSGFCQDGFQLYYKAKKFMLQREYDKALQSFELLRVKFPNSKYMDDAEFWTAYILERQKKFSESFKKYERLKTTYPKSPWVDDAEVQQIGIAEKLANRGEKHYVDYLVKKLKSSDKTIKYQASLSLAKLSDRRALPGLRQMANNGDKDMSRMAKSLIRKIESKNLQPGTDSKIIPRRSYNGKEKNINKRQIPSPQSRLSKPKAKTIKPPSSSNSRSSRSGTSSPKKKKK